MELSEQTLWILGIVLFFGLIVPHLLRRLQLPFAAALIIAGAALGPNGLEYVNPDQTIEILAYLGATFQMLLAGFEAETLQIREAGKRFWGLAVLSTVLPFGTGTAIVKLLGYDWVTSLFIGTLFISSSILMVFASVENLGLDKDRMGKTLKSLAVVQDLTCSLIIFIFLQYISPHERFPLPILLGLLISSIVVLRMFLPEVVSFFFKRFERLQEPHEAQLRLIFVILFFVLIFYSSLDVHPIIGAFLVGFLLSEISQSKLVKEKLNTIGYALFIPVYLFITGVKINPQLLFELTPQNYLALLLIGGALFSKVISGFLGARLARFSSREASVIGISSSTKLTVTISSALIALSMGLIDDELYSAILMTVVLSIIINPALMYLLMKKKTPADHV